MSLSRINSSTALYLLEARRGRWLVRTAYGLRSGTNAFHGEAVGLWRPGGIQARAPLSLTRTADRLGQVSGSFSGPIRRDSTHFLLAAEYNHQDRDATITSPLAPGNFTGHNRQVLFLSRLDHRINDCNTLTGRINFDRFYDTNPGDTAVGGLSLPSCPHWARRWAALTT